MKNHLLMLAFVTWLAISGLACAAVDPGSQLTTGQRLADLSAQFYSTLSDEQKTRTDRGEEIQLAGWQLTPEQQQIVLEWLRLLAEIRPLPPELAKDIAEQKPHLIEIVGVIGNPPSIRVWTTSGSYIDRIRTTEKKRPEAMPLLLRQESLIRQLFSSLSPEQHKKAQPSSSLELFQSGGLSYSQMTPTQQKIMVELDRLGSELAVFVNRDHRPGRPENYRLLFWLDGISAAPQGFLGFGSSGKLVGAETIGGPRTGELTRVQLKMAQELWQRLSPDQKKKAQTEAGIPFQELDENQQELFLQISEIKLLLTGEGRGHLRRDSATWKLAYLPAQSMHAETRDVLLLQLRSVGGCVPVDGKPFRMPSQPRGAE